jgi:hypothetical protein
MIDEITIRRHYDLLRPSLDERGRRLFAASQVRALGYGGLAAVARATGITWRLGSAYPSNPRPFLYMGDEPPLPFSGHTVLPVPPAGSRQLRLAHTNSLSGS